MLNTIPNASLVAHKTEVRETNLPSQRCRRVLRNSNGRSYPYNLHMLQLATMQ